ncbi:MAG: NitT/TauT family transport system ATP-binding protein/nitrate [Alphaproteobacteria bacterium]|jgi:NitT/TauT family transport system ATP-binding protein/nitrate/nitrite transport system substrate-binding protein
MFSMSIGFVPLTDSAPLVVAQHKGLFTRYGLDVRLEKQNSWATLRDKLQAGLLNSAQLLAPMPLASSLGLGSKQVPIIVPMVLSQNGNAFTVSKSLYHALLAHNQLSELPFPLDASSLLPLIKHRQVNGLPKLRFATVFPYSGHQYQLLDWLNTASIAQDVELLVIPPSNMAESLESGFIDGFCVGGPWNAKTVRNSSGVSLFTSYHVWKDKPEKVLGVTQSFFQEYPQHVIALGAALLDACHWLHSIPNRFEAAKWLSHPDYLNEPIEVIAPSLIGSCLVGADQDPIYIPHYNRFTSNYEDANCPKLQHATWLLEKMRCANQINTLSSAQIEKVKNTTFRPDIFRRIQALREGQ